MPRESHLLADAASPDVGGRASAILAIPLGSTEQHGAHLPLSTDTDLAVALCRGLAQRRDDVLIAPSLAYGSSGEHAGFAGTISIGQQALELVILELGRSAAESFDHLLFVSGHGGNAEPAGRAVDQLRAESRDVCLFFPRWQGDPHAGRQETSLQLALDPQRVRMDRVVAGDTRPIAETWPLLRSGGVRAVTATGILGDPRGANAVEGERLLARLTDDLARAVASWRAPVVVQP